MFRDMIENNLFAEYIQSPSGFYGTSVEAIRSATAMGMLVLIEIDVAGAQRLKKQLHFAARYVFIKPPSFKALEARLSNRATENEDSIQKRMDRARHKIQCADIPGVDDPTIVNDDPLRLSRSLRRISSAGPTEKELFRVVL